MSGLFSNKYPYTDFHEMDLSWIIEKIQELNVNLDTLEERVKASAIEASKEYINETVIPEFNRLEGEFNQLVITVDGQIETLNRQYTEFSRNVQSQIELMTQRINAFRDELNASIIGVNARTDLAIQQNNEFIFDKIAEGLIDLRVINYFTGEKVTVQSMFDYLAQFHLQNAITYAELAERDRNYNEYADYNMTFTQLALNGGAIII